MSTQQMIAVASGKGGVGKTWCSVSLCMALADQGKRVLLFDGDLGLANVDIQLGLVPTCDVMQALRNGVPLRNAITKYQDNFHIIAGQSGSGMAGGLTSAHVRTIEEELTALAERYDYTFLDLGAGIDKTVRALAAIAKRIIMVVSPDPTSITDAYAFIKVVREQQPGASFRILVNMAEDKNQGEKTYRAIAKACQNFLKFTPPLLGIICRDKLVVDSIRRQTPTQIAHPNTQAVHEVKGLLPIV